MLEALLRDGEISNGWNGVADDLGPLAVYALLCPFADVLTNGWPDHLGADDLPRLLDESESVELIKDPSSACKRDVRSRWTV